MLAWNGPNDSPGRGATECSHTVGGHSVVVSRENRKDTLPVSFYPCSNCGQRPPGKLATVYANWFEGEKRAAWRNRLCVGCLTTLMGSLKGGESGDSSILTVCPMCGVDAAPTLNGIYLTVYPPKQSEREYALTTCASCAASLQKLLSERGDALGDRSVGAAAPTDSPSSAWSSIPW